MSVPWPPARFSEPLSADFPSLFRKYRDVFRIAWMQGHGHVLDDWQEQLLCAITELRPDGRLRWRQVLVSLGRQNGKTSLAAALGLLFLIAHNAPQIVGIASSAEQARLVYDRLMTVINRNPSFAKMFDKLTDTRGIRAKDGGRYEIKAAKSAALQGIPVGLGIVDEVHLLKMSLWTDLVNGTGGRPDCLVVGITTAGDDSSVLLKHLYEVEAESVGKFIWEAPEARVPDDDETLLEYLRAANPAIASGRIDERIVLEDVRSMPHEDAIRYRLNRFVSGSDGFIDGAKWMACIMPAGFERPTAKHVVFSVDVTRGWDGASIVATYKDDDRVYSELVWTMPNPKPRDVDMECDRLARKFPGSSWVIDGYMLKDLAHSMKAKRRQVRVTSQADVCSASALLYRKVVQKQFMHDGSTLLRVQVPASGRKSIGEGFRIIGKGSQIDGVMATALGVWGVETLKPTSSPIR